MDLNLGGSKKKQHHVRKKYSIITLDLFKPTKKSYPEFDYEKICKEYLKEDESSGEDERFHDREAEELVRRLEQKYGGKRDKHGRKIRFGCADDYMDKTAGYDLTDPFIDDTEAYDEHVPSALDTARGGFYVNKGKLEFKSKYAEDDGDSDIEETVGKKKTVEKRRRISSDEEAGDNKRTCFFPPTKQPVDSSTSLTDSPKGSNPPPPIRLSSSGAAPTAKPGDTARSRLLTQQYIKKRRLLGQPPMAKIQSPTVKAALGVKKKLKPQAKRATIEMTDEDLAGFLKDMTGGEVESVEGLENVISAKEKTAPVEHDTDIDKPLTPPVEKVPQPDVASSSGLAMASSSAAIPKRSPGRPPGSTVQHKQMPIMSDRLRAMIDTYKQKTKEYGAPNKKIRLPPSLVDLCIRIEEQCTLECFNHQQKTRIFDLLANWVCVQRNSLYIRMKAHRDRHEPNATSDSDINADEPASETKEAPRCINDEKLCGSNDSSSSVITVSSSPVVSDSSPRSPIETLTVEKKEQLIGVKNTTSSDAARSFGARQPAVKEGSEKSATSDATFSFVSVTKSRDCSTSSKTGWSPSLSTSPPKGSLTTNASSTLNNTQLLSVFATMLQQARGDPIRQQHCVVDNLTAQMNAHLLSTKQQSELLSQYQLTLSNFAKMTSITPTSSAKGMVPSKSAASKSDLQPSKPQPKPNRLLSTNSSTSSPIKGLKQLTNEKASRALKEINSALAQVVSEIEKAVIQTENEYVKEKVKVEKEGKNAVTKRFVWTDSLRTALKKQVTLLFSSLEQHGDPTHIVNPTVVQYLYYTVRPLFKDYVKFRDLVLEILRLCPERRQLVLIPEMKAFIELSDSSKTQSGTSQATSRSVKTAKADILSSKISPNKSLPNAELRKASDGVDNSGLRQTSNVVDFRSLNILDKKENYSVKCSNGEEVEILAEKTSIEKTRSPSSRVNRLSKPITLEAPVQKKASSGCSSVLFNTKLSAGQKIMIVRGNKEREKLLAEKAAAEKALREREELERKLQEAERLEASRDEDEDLGAIEAEDYSIRQKDSELQEIEEVELGADTEVDMNTEEDVNVDQKSGSQICNSESEQACSSTETEQPILKKTESCNNILSEQSSSQNLVATSSAHSTSLTCPHSSPLPRITHSQNIRQTDLLHFASSSSYKMSSPIAQIPSQKLPSTSVCAPTNFSPGRFSEIQRSNPLSQRQSSPLEHVMREIMSVTSQDLQVSNSYQSSCIQQQSSCGVKQSRVASPISLSNSRHPPTFHSISSYAPTSTHTSGSFTTSQVSYQQPAFSPYSIQQRQMYKNPQSQQTSMIRHASQVSQHLVQEHVQPRQHGPLQHPYSCPASPFSTSSTIQKTSTLPTCSIPQNASHAYNSILSPSEQVIYSQRSVSSTGCSSAFSPLPQPSSRQQQSVTHQSAYNQHQQFSLQQHHQQRHRQLYDEQQQQQQQQQMTAVSQDQMYSNWR
uniref:Hpc2-related domain-containing protein n=1 Tax=Setaria digitata TaxID=48799 RepID=A0A915Q3Y4_9BILA